MTSIATTLGAGSGIDTTALVTSLVAASYDPKDQALKAKEDANTARISSLGTLTNGIDNFATALSSLIAGGTLRSAATSSNAAVLTATAQPGASIGGLSTQLEVRQLAQAQSLVSAPLAAAGGPVGQGQLTLQVGQLTRTVTVDATNDSLAGLAGAITAAGAGLTASVVTDATGARLVVKGPTGAAGAFTLTPAADADPGLARFAYGADGTGGQTAGLTQAQAAQDAIVRLDGVDVARATNSVSDLVPGVTLNLVSASPGTAVTLGAQRPGAAIAQAVGDFADAYNELHAQLATATAAPSADGSTPAGPLYGNPAVRGMAQALTGLTAARLSGTGSVHTLAEVGVRTKADGTLAVDTAALNRALAADPDGVEALFNPTQTASDPRLRIASAYGATKPGTYSLTNIVAAGSAASATGNASGSIAGVAAVTTGRQLFAASTSAAAGLVIEPLGDVAAATVTVDPGLGGALQAVRDALRATNGSLASLGSQLAATTTDLAKQRTTMISQQAAYKASLTNQFTAMDTRVAAYKQTQAYLTQQIAAWNKSDS